MQVTDIEQEALALLNEVTTIVGRAKQLLDYASADCSECGCPSASFGHGLAVEVEQVVERLADLALRQPTQSDAREALGLELWGKSK